MYREQYGEYAFWCWVEKGKSYLGVYYAFLLTYCAILAAKTPPRRHPHSPHLWRRAAPGLSDVSDDDVKSRHVLSESAVLRIVSRDSAHHLYAALCWVRKKRKKSKLYFSEQAVFHDSHAYIFCTFWKIFQRRLIFSRTLGLNFCPFISLIDVI